MRRLIALDLRSLAALRVAFGAVLLLDLCMRAPDLHAHYSDGGVLPRELFFKLFPWPLWPSLHLASGSAAFQAALFALAAVFAFFVLVGYRTRLSTVVSWLLLVSLQHRNPMVHQSADILLRCFLFWGMFLPWGALYSVDRALQRERRSLPATVSTAATAGFLAQVALLYLFSALHKSGPTWREDGTAIYYALSLDSLARAPARLLLDFPGLMEKMTFSVYWVELLLPALLVVPVATQAFRVLAAAAILGLHLGFLFMLRIGIFPLVNMASALALLPPRFWNALEQRLRRPAASEIAIFYDGECGFCRRGVLVLRTFLFLGETRMQPAQEDARIWRAMQETDSWVVRNERGELFFRFEAGVEALRASPVFFFLAPLLRLAPLRRLGALLYAPLPRMRARLSHWFLPGHTPAAPRLRLGSAASVLLSLLIVYVAVWNLSGLYPRSMAWFQDWKWPGRLLGLEQAWMMFGPDPSEYDNWWIVAGRLRGGEELDLLGAAVGGEASELRFEKPESIAATYDGNVHWRSYLLALSKPGPLKRVAFARYVCRTWNAEHRGPRALESLELVAMNQRTLPDGAKEEPARILLVRGRCEDGNRTSG